MANGSASPWIGVGAAHFVKGLDAWPCPTSIRFKSLRSLTASAACLRTIIGSAF